MIVSVADLLDALDGVPAQACKIAEHRQAIEIQHATAAELKSGAVRISADGLAFDLGRGIILEIRGAFEVPTPRGSPVLHSMAVLPTSEEDVEDLHGGWAQ
jgi:hypothetical protein